MQCFANNSFNVIDSSKGYNLKYIWNFGNGNTSTNSKPNPENYKLSGKYKVKLNVVSNYAGCVSDSVIHTVNVLKNPKADFKFNMINLEGQHFFTTLRNKMMWGIDKRQ